MPTPAKGRRNDKRFDSDEKMNFLGPTNTRRLGLGDFDRTSVGRSTCSCRQSACQMEAPILRRTPFVHLAISRPSKVRIEARREDIKQEHTPKGGDF